MTRRSVVIVFACFAALFGFSFWQTIARIPGGPNSNGRAVLRSPNALEAAQQAQPEGMIDVRSYGAMGDGVTDDTAAIRAAKAKVVSLGSGTMYFSRGEYITDTITLSYYPIHIHYIGEGSHCVTLTARDPNKPIFQGGGVAGGNGVGKQRISGFTLRAHASGSTGPAIDMSNTGDMVVEDISFAEHALYGSEQWTYGFLFDASSYCYCNTVRGVRIRANDPISTAVVKFDHHANAHHFSEFYITGYSQPKMAFSFPDANAADAVHHIVIENSHFEGLHATSPAVIAVGSANNNIVVQNCYFEDVVKAFDERATSSCALYNNYFASSPGTSQPTRLGDNYYRLYNAGGEYTQDNVGSLDAATTGRVFGVTGPISLNQKQDAIGGGLNLYALADRRDYLKLWASADAGNIQAGDQAGSRTLYLNPNGGMVRGFDGGLTVDGHLYATSMNPWGGQLNQWDDVNVPSSKGYKIGGTKLASLRASVVDVNVPSGPTTKAIAVYDAKGNQLGYVPVYANKW